MNPTWIPEQTEDGSFTFFSTEFGETFHSRQGAREEAFTKFVQATNLPTRAKQQAKIHLLDVCYGLGYNTAAALATIWQINSTCQVELIGLESDATVPQAAIESSCLESWPEKVQAILRQLALDHRVETDRVQAKLLIGDARQTILCQTGYQADAIFLDPFSPRRCPQLWTVEFLSRVAHCLQPTGQLATYCRAAAVRSALIQVGLHIGTIPLTTQHSPHEWAQGTIAGSSKVMLHPLSQAEQEHLQTRAAIPYRDPHLCDTAQTILERRRQEQARSNLASTSSWRRRWGIDA